MSARAAAGGVTNKYLRKENNEESEERVARVPAISPEEPKGADRIFLAAQMLQDDSGLKAAPREVRKVRQKAATDTRIYTALTRPVVF